ncbi:hypothetical protein D770_05460 [Flammeovirgaceae bacterium 311]|nr:hypothetical protein D770_05460 [Flammeovirgaceae bacterium 311]
MNKAMKIFCTSLIGFIILSALQAAACDKVRLKLPENVEVELYRGSTNAEGYVAYYYLPFGLRIAEQGGKAEFLYQPYDDGNSTGGAIIHMLLSWGPTAKQELQIMEGLASLGDSLVHLKGAVTLDFAGTEALVIESALFNRALSAPPGRLGMPGAKTAFAFHFKGADALALKKLLNNPAQLQRVVFRWQGKFKETYCPTSTRTPVWQEWVLEENLKNMLKNIY